MPMPKINEICLSHILNDINAEIHYLIKSFSRRVSLFVCHFAFLAQPEGKEITSPMLFVTLATLHNVTPTDYELLKHMYMYTPKVSQKCKNDDSRSNRSDCGWNHIFIDNMISFVCTCGICVLHDVSLTESLYVQLYAENSLSDATLSGEKSDKVSWIECHAVEIVAHSHNFTETL